LPVCRSPSRLADDTIEAIGDAAERDHAHRHQLLLYFAVQTRLRDDRRVGVIEVLEQVLLDGGDVIDRFGHHPRQFLEAGEAIELEGIEIGMLLTVCAVCDCICSSAWISISRNCRRRRMTFSVRSRSDP
jgi:hypothetical protein